jgi:hypothetical protein
MTPDAVTDPCREKGSLPRLFRVFAWFLCLLLVGGMGGPRGAGLAALANFADGGSSSTSACAGGLAVDCDASHDSNSQDSDSQDDSDSQAHSDLEPVEGLAVPELQIDLAPPDSTEISTPYSGKRRSAFSSPEPRPAERV